MCCDTKRRMANSLMKVLEHKPLRKVTVQDIMSVEHMHRQSFYYHFQDIYAVVEWMFQEDFLAKLQYKESESFQQWIEKMAVLIGENSSFYQNMVANIERERIIHVLYPLVLERVQKQLLKNHGKNVLLEQFLSRSICHYIIDIIDIIENRKVITKEEFSMGFVNLYIL